jgi:hypothetical protein
MKNIFIIVGALLLISTGANARVRQDKDAAAIDASIARQAHSERGQEYRDARKVVVGDLTGDSEAETVVLYTIEGQRGSNNYVQYLTVFAREGGRLSPVATAEVGGKSVRSVDLRSIKASAIELDTLSYGPKDATCCPSVKGTTRYVLVGKRLREQKSGATKGRHN